MARTSVSAGLLAGAVIIGGLATASGAMAQAIGVSWSNFQEERWKTDEAAIKAAIAAGGGTYISADAQSSAAKQLADVEALIARGAKAIIVLAQDANAVRPAVEKALNEGIPVIGYDRLIEIKEVGRIQAREVFKLKPAGNYVFIKGSSADPNADFLHAGQLEIVKPAIDAGRIKVVGETYTDGWLPANAQRNMEQFLTANNNKVDAVVASNDGTAGGVVAALTAQGLAGSVPVSGQDGDVAALNRVALGTQTVSVWKDSRALGKAAGEAAMKLAKGSKPADLLGVVTWADGPRKVPMTSLLLTPVAITKDNLDVVVSAGWVSRDVVCRGVKAGMAKVCP